MLHIKLKGNTCRTLCKFDLMHTPGLLGWVKRLDIEIVKTSELSELVVLSDYGPCGTQDDFRGLRNGIYILLLTSSPCDKNSGERSRDGPSCLNKDKYF